ncbi:hypothetical protein IPA_02465 [Ignicoccus pacificus DSM 13166]|uniref:CBS domain-containing protein n=1 Tax=Ignicoccus pacificus DSM 13166 TaxID=940294 RepID=A0A977KC76_9CREN|nr:hypothetical protein IPA_02465 [Ignicoccus pacificus DSM 13166]
MLLEIWGFQALEWGSEWRRHYVNVMDYATKRVIGISPENDLMSAANLMIELRIRHLPVKDSSNRLIGMIGMREIASVLLQGGREALEKEKVSDHINVQPVKVTPDVPLLKAVELMLEAGVGSVVIVDDMDRIQGIVTEKDLVKFLAVVPSIERVENITTNISTYVLAGSSVREVLELMMELWTRHLVMSKEGKVIGIVNMTDLVRKGIEESLSAPADEVVEPTEVVPPSTPISQVAALMVAKGKEAVLVGPKDSPDGIVTERNMVRGALEVLSRL